MALARLALGMAHFREVRPRSWRGEKIMAASRNKQRRSRILEISENKAVSYIIITLAAKPIFHAPLSALAACLSSSAPSSSPLSREAHRRESVINVSYQIGALKEAIGPLILREW